MARGEARTIRARDGCPVGREYRCRDRFVDGFGVRDRSVRGVRRSCTRLPCIDRTVLHGHRHGVERSGLLQGCSAGRDDAARCLGRHLPAAMPLRRPHAGGECTGLELALNSSQGHPLATAGTQSYLYTPPHRDSGDPVAEPGGARLNLAVAAGTYYLAVTDSPGSPAAGNAPAATVVPLRPSRAPGGIESDRAGPEHRWCAPRRQPSNCARDVGGAGRGLQ